MLNLFKGKDFQLLLAEQIGKEEPKTQCPK